MITLKEWMEVVGYRITEGDAWYSEAFGYDAHCLSAWNGVHGHGGWSFNIVFDTKTQLVYQVEACDYTNDRAYRLINPLYKEAVEKQSKNDSYANQAWDDVDYTDLEVNDDWIQKALAIVAGEEYDTRISIPVDFTDEELLKYMVIAHERDMKFNDFIEEALRAAIEEHQRDPVSFEEKNKKYFEELKKEKTFDERMWEKSMKNLKKQKKNDIA
jgi:hypothetical protein